MSSSPSAIVSLLGLLIGAGLASVGAIYKEPALIQLGSTICGGALGAFIPQLQMPKAAPTPTTPPPPTPPR